MLGKTEERRRRGQQRTRWLDGISDSMDVSLSKLPELVKDRETWRAAVHRVSSFTFIKRLFSSSSLSAVRVVSSAYLRLLILLPAIPA